MPCTGTGTGFVCTVEESSSQRWYSGSCHYPPNKRETAIRLLGLPAHLGPRLAPEPTYRRATILHRQGSFICNGLAVEAFLEAPDRSKQRQNPPA